MTPGRSWIETTDSALEAEHDLAAVIAIGAAHMRRLPVHPGAGVRGLAMDGKRTLRAAETLRFYTGESDVRRRYAEALATLRSHGRAADWPDEPWSGKS